MPSRFQGWADDKIKNMGVHSSTHIDAPWHYSPIVEGKKAKTIDEIPLKWLYGDGILIDMSHKKDLEVITAEDIKIILLKTISLYLHKYCTNSYRSRFINRS